MESLTLMVLLYVELVQPDYGHTEKIDQLFGKENVWTELNWLDGNGYVEVNDSTRSMVTTAKGKVL